MRYTELKKLLSQQPFQPFRMLLSNGKAYEVRHPELVIVTHSTVILGEPDAREPPPVVADYHIISLLHIVEIEPVIQTRRSRRGA
jgi:hypothetical protein